MTALPAYTDQQLANLTPSELVALLIENEDRAPRNLIDACAMHGEAMVETLQGLHSDALWQATQSDGEWWLRLHAAMILGLVSTESAGRLLLDMMRRMSQVEDHDLQDWLASHWSALFHNKPASVIPALRELCEDNSLDWYIRGVAVEAVADHAVEQGSDVLDEALAWLATLAADEAMHWDVRLSACSCLLDIPREQYRSLLDSMAKRQGGIGTWFKQEDVEAAYAKPQRRQEKMGLRKQPWGFYEPEAIAARQQRWKEEDERARLRETMGIPDDDEPYYFEEPYVRQEPKTGRNDPCPCGSGKKYKKCCLDKA